ncbi:TraR/DksA C4-type zinc finger protein [Acinetobacter bereziniae]|uniref:TraR/DksA C4-type zinc finger protein n=1 Tax=Acinetobacter bereziniae TaxID=106648 RepID=UPI001D0E329A
MTVVDILDIAQQRQLEQVHVKPRDYTIPSLSECKECGNDIPPERQKYGAVTLCIACQTNHENNKRTYR